MCCNEVLYMPNISRFGTYFLTLKQYSERTAVFFVLFATNDLAVFILDEGLLEIRILGTAIG